MRVLYFHQYFCTPEGNTGIRSYEMARYLIESGHEVTMVYAESPRLKSPLANKSFQKGLRRGSYMGIDLIEYDLKYSNKMSILKRSMVFLRYSIRSIKLAFTEKYDLMFATSTPITAGIPGIIVKIVRKKTPFVFEVRDLWPELPREMGVIKNRFLLWTMDVLEYLSYNKADACIALSPGIRDGIKRKLKKDKPVHLIPNGCDLEMIRPGHHDKTIFPGCQNEDFIAIFLGAHGRANGLDAAINTAICLRDRTLGGNIKIVMIGDGALKMDLVEKTKRENLSNLIFLDPIPKKNLLPYLWAADVGLMLLANIPAFYYGTSPNKFFDYISAGLPVLNNYPGWLAEMINENNIGVVVPPDDPLAFADSLISLAGDDVTLKLMGSNARQFAERQFNRQKLAKDFISALRSAAN